MMKKAETKSRKKFIIVGIGIIFLFMVSIILVIPGWNPFTEEDLPTAEQSVDGIVEAVANNATSSSMEEEKEIHLVDYNDLKDNVVYGDELADNAEITYKANADSSSPDTRIDEKTDAVTANNIKQSNSTVKTQQDGLQVDSEANVTIVDESAETIIDESVNNEYDGEKNQDGIEFFDVKPSGKDVNGDVEASGIHIGTWD